MPYLMPYRYHCSFKLLPWLIILTPPVDDNICTPEKTARCLRHCVCPVPWDGGYVVVTQVDLHQVLRNSVIFLMFQIAFVDLVIL